MFTLKWLEEIAKGAGVGLERLNSRVLEALGKRIALAARGSGFDRLFTLSGADREAERLYREILNELGRSANSVEEIYVTAAKLAYKSANKYYAAKGLEQIPIEYQTAIINFVRGVAATTRGTFANLSNTGAIGFRVMNADGKVIYRGFKEHYHNLVDQAIAEVATGQKSYNSAFRQALKQTADSGIRVLDYESGYSRRLDSAMRQNVIDGVKDIAHEIARQTGEEFGADGVEIDAHNFCAPDHLPFQGRQFSKAEFEQIQEELPRDFGMWNCRHTFMPIILGVSSPLYTEAERQAMIANSTEKRVFEGKEYTAYEATQLQRRIEAEMRKAKDRAVLAAASGDDLTRKVEQLRLNQLKQKYGEITTLFKTPAALDRAAVSGFRPVKAETSYPPGWFDASDLTLDQKVIQINSLNEEKHVLILGDVPERVKRYWSDIETNKWVLTGERRNHIYETHPEMKGLMEDLIRMVVKPDDVHTNTFDPRIAILYKKYDVDRYLRAALWVTNDPVKLNSIHSYRFAKVKEYLQGLENGRSTQ